MLSRHHQAALFDNSSSLLSAPEPLAASTANNEQTKSYSNKARSSDQDGSYITMRNDRTKTELSTSSKSSSSSLGLLDSVVLKNAEGSEMLSNTLAANNNQRGQQQTHSSVPTLVSVGAHGDDVESGEEEDGRSVHLAAGALDNVFDSIIDASSSSAEDEEQDEEREEAAASSVDAKNDAELDGATESEMRQPSLLSQALSRVSVGGNPPAGNSSSTFTVNTVGDPFSSGVQRISDFGALPDASDNSDEFFPMSESRKLSMIREAEEENAKEYRFIEEDAMLNGDKSVDASAWNAPTSYSDDGKVVVSRPKSTSRESSSRLHSVLDALPDESKWSPTVFFTAKGNPIGSLRNDSDRGSERPNWGTDLPSTTAIHVNESQTTAIGADVKLEKDDSSRRSDNKPTKNVERIPETRTPPSSTSTDPPLISTPIPPNHELSHLSERDDRVGALPTFGSISAVATPKNRQLLARKTTFLTDGQKADVENRSSLVSYGGASASFLANNSTVVSQNGLSQIGRLVANASTSANESVLAQRILEAKTKLQQIRDSDQHRKLLDTTNLKTITATTGSDASTATTVLRQSTKENRQTAPTTASLTTVSQSLKSATADDTNIGVSAFNLPSSTTDSSKQLSFPTAAAHGKLQANKERLLFGCIHVGGTAMQSATVKNVSKEVLSLRIRVHRPNRCFQLCDFGTSSSENCVLLHPSETFVVRVAFHPDKIATFSNKVLLEIDNPYLRFSLTLLGFGGRADVRVSDRRLDKAQEKSPFYSLFTSSLDSASFTLRNSGERPAFACLYPFYDRECSKSANAVVSPEAVCIMNDQIVHFTVKQSTTLADPLYLMLLWGEEIQRQRLKRLELTLRTPLPYGNDTFTKRPFVGEEQASGLAPGIDVFNVDYRLFVGSLRRLTIELTTDLSRPPSSRSSSIDAFGYGRISSRDVSRCSSSFRTLASDRTDVHGLSVFVDPTPSDSISPSRAQLKRPYSPNRLPERDGKKALEKLADPNSSRTSSRSSAVMTVSVNPKSLEFMRATVGATDNVKLEFRNEGEITHTLNLTVIDGPFRVRFSTYKLASKKYVKMPVEFEPQFRGCHEGLLCVTVSNGQTFRIRLRGDAV